MKRAMVSKRLLNLLEYNDVVVVSGPGLVGSFFEYDDNRLFYFERLGLAMGFSLGLAIATNKRVFVVCEDVEVLRNYELIAQMAVSECKNIFLVIVGCNTYQDAGGMPSIYDRINSPKGSMFNLGMAIHNFTPYFTRGGSMKDLKGVIERIRGPMVIELYIDSGITNSENNYEQSIDITKRFMKFVRDLELGTSLFVP